jgi:2-dehydropantoate 2-reductase
MRIAILGSGGVGGYFGGRLAATGVDVTFVARGAHLAAMRQRGLRIDRPDGPLHVANIKATDDTASIGPVDIVFFAVKLYDTEGAIAALGPLIGPGTLVIPFQNGVDAVDLLTRAVGRGHVVGGTTYVSAVISEPGVIKYTAMGRLVFGALSGPAPALLKELLSVCQNAGVDATLSERITVDIWAKFARLTVFSGITSIARSPIGVVRTDPDLRKLMEAALHESIHVARSKQVPVAHSIFNDSMASLDALPPHTKASMLEDLERGRPLELPWLSGAVVRIGHQVGVDTPTHRLIVSLLRAHQNGTKA